MALQLRHKVLRSSTSAIRSVHFCGVGTSLKKSTLLPPLMPSSQHFHSLFGSSFTLLKPGDSPPPALHYDEETAKSRRRFRARDLVRRYGLETPKEELLREGGGACSMTSQAAATVMGLSLA